MFNLAINTVVASSILAIAAHAAQQDFAIWQTSIQSQSNPSGGCDGSGGTTCDLSYMSPGDNSCNDLDFQSTQFYNNYYGFCIGEPVSMFSMSDGLCGDNYDFYSGSNGDYAMYISGGDGTQVGSCSPTGGSCEIPSPCSNYYGFGVLYCSYTNNNC